MSLDTISCSAYAKLLNDTGQQMPLLCWNAQVIVIFTALCKLNTNLTKINDNRSCHYHIIAIQDCTFSFNQSISQSILFLIKCYIINALSSVQWNTHISLNTYIYIYSEIQHTYKHSYKAAISAQIQFFISCTHSLTLVNVVSGRRVPYSW